MAAVQRSLPPPIRELAAKLPVIYQGRPDASLLEGEFEPDILGLFVGDHHGMEGGMGNSVPPQIFLFLENIPDEAGGDPSRYEEEVRVTYLHELGHYLGWDEDDVEARGL